MFFVSPQALEIYPELRKRADICVTERIPMKFENLTEVKSYPCSNFGCKKMSDVLINGRTPFCKKCGKKFVQQQERGRG